MTSGPAHDPHEQPLPDRTPGDAAPSAPARQTYTLRRAPRLGAVVVLSVLLGLLAGLLATLVSRSTGAPLIDPYSGAPLTFGSTFGFMAFACTLAAVVLGLLVWLVLDRRSRRAERTVVLERTEDPAAADVTLPRAEAEDLRARLSDPAAPRTGTDASPTPERTADR